MNYASYLIFLGALSIVSLSILASLHILDFANVTSKQKIIFIRIGLAIICCVTIIFCIKQFYSFDMLEIIWSDRMSNQLPIRFILPVSAESHTDWAMYIFVFYAAGLMIMLLKILFSYIKSGSQLVYSIKRRIQKHDVLLSEKIQSPLIFGFPKAKIYLPLDMEEKWTTREIMMCLAHEKIHIEQNDNLWKLLSFVIEALLFFAPWAYLLHKKFELEMEIFCDEKTCTRANASIQEYGNLLLAMTSAQPNNFIFTNIKTSTLKRRILAMKSKGKRRTLLVSAFSAFVLLAGGSAVATLGDTLKDKSIFKITSKIFVDGELVSTPQIIAYANQKATITLSNKMGNPGLKISLIAKESEKNNIKINYDFQYDDGSGKVHAKPEMVLVLNQEGAIQITSDSGHSYEMKVIAERQ